MEDVKWLFNKYGFLLVLMVIIVIISSVVLGRRGSEGNAEEVWEPPVVVESKDSGAEDDVMIESVVEESTESTEEISVWESTAPVSVLTAEEEQRLRDEALSAAEQCMELYKDVRISYPQTSYSYIENFSDEQRKGVVKCLGEQGLVSVSDDINMENYQKVEEFYSVYLSGGDAMVTVFDVRKDGNIGALTFIHRNGKIQTYYVTVGWKEGGIPETKGSGCSDLETIRLTEKGYFIYKNKEVIAHGNVQEYYRVRPLSDECRELTKKYIYGLSFVNYNMLVTDWDAGNVEDILMPCMFEDIYRVYTGEPLKCNAALCSRRKKHFIFDSMNTITAPSFR